MKEERKPALIAAGVVALDAHGRLYELYQRGEAEVWRNSEGRELHVKFLTDFHKLS